MPDADRRVPTAADVERCEREGRQCYWWFEVAGFREPVRLEVDGRGRVHFHVQWAQEPLVTMYGPHCWHGPVNPEPMP